MEWEEINCPYCGEINHMTTLFSFEHAKNFCVYAIDDDKMRIIGTGTCENCREEVEFEIGARILFRDIEPVEYDEYDDEYWDTSDEEFDREEEEGF